MQAEEPPPSHHTLYSGPGVAPLEYKINPATVAAGELNILHQPHSTSDGGPALPPLLDQLAPAGKGRTGEKTQHARKHIRHHLRLMSDLL